MIIAQVCLRLPPSPFQFMSLYKGSLLTKYLYIKFLSLYFPDDSGEICVLSSRLLKTILQNIQ